MFGKDSAKWSTAQKTTLWLSFIGLSVRGIADVLDKGSGIFLNFAGGIGKLAGAFKTLKGAQGFKTTRINYNGYGNPTGSSQTWSEPYYPN